MLVYKNNNDNAILYKDPIRQSNIDIYIKMNSYKVDQPTWGTTMWYFLHTFANNINNEKYNDISYQLINTIQTIGNNLPCYSCTQHAIKYFSDNILSIDTIKTSNELKLYLFNFHNNVNKDTGKKILNENILEKYSFIPLNIIYKQFLKIYEYNKTHETDETDEILNKVKTFFDNII